MTRYRRILRVLIWDTALAFIPPVLLLALNETTTLRGLLINFGFSLIYAHSIGSLAFLIVPRVWCLGGRLGRSAQWAFRWLAAIAVAVAGAMLAGVILVALRWNTPAEFWPQFTGNLKLVILLTVAATAVIAMYEIFRERLEDATLQLRTKELERERALKLATEAQLASLESRIHPHFLFNTLNSISSLIPEDPARAERLVEQMAALLRFSLDSNHSGVVPLASEMKIVSDYLSIEQARFGGRLRYEIEVPENIGEAVVPPLAVQTLVENSVKYAIAPNREGGEVRVTAARDNGLVRVEVADSGPAFRLESAPAGHGLDNLKGRLATLFDQRAALSLERKDGHNAMILSIPQTTNGHAGVSSR
ncbi:MAG TPA: histidine kinase [Bryobacteraceae bacterium]|nr:histidine kinase [Bryobacteraceae bacterium]